jgi:hypothetical protein
MFILVSCQNEQKKGFEKITYVCVEQEGGAMQHMWCNEDYAIQDLWDSAV